MVIDLHTSLTLRNSGPRRVRGVTLLVTAQEVTAGGKASVSVPSLNVGPGETFPVRIDLRLLRPLFPAGPLVAVSLDGVLFDDLSFYGPNRLNSRRSMTVWEMEARRDRRHFKSVLAAQGEEGLRKTLLESMARQADRPRVDVQVARGGRATNARGGAARPVRVPAHAGCADRAPGRHGADRGQRGPRAEPRGAQPLRRPVRYFELGWIIRDCRGPRVPGGFGAGFRPRPETGAGPEAAGCCKTLRCAFRALRAGRWPSPG